MGWKSKLSRRRGEKKRRSKSEIGTIRCNYQPSHLKSCLKKRSNNGDDGQSSFSSSSTSFRSGESGPLDQRSSSVQESQRTHLTDSTGSCSYLSRAAFKNVRFHEIEIREYRRTVGDNPSVSMGPPVGLDWVFDQTVKMDLTGYEGYRGPRREQLEMVLTRHERENLLIEWGVPNYLIADGTRNALRVKNQRKQTVVNAGKVAKLEEVIESASKRFKEALAFPKKSRSTDSISSRGSDEEKKEGDNESADFGRSLQNTTISMEIHTTPTSNIVRNVSNRVISVEPDMDILERMGMNVSLSNIVKLSPDGALMASCSSLEQFVEWTDDYARDDAYTLGATTFGHNSASPSVLEMERFYQELEREMFGEEASLPCMVGQTLEVNTCEYDISEHCDDMTVASSPHSASCFHMSERASSPCPPHMFDSYQVHRDAGPVRDVHNPLHQPQTQQYVRHLPTYEYDQSPSETLWAQYHSIYQLNPAHQPTTASSHNAFVGWSQKNCHRGYDLTSTSTQRQLQHFRSVSTNQMVSLRDERSVHPFEIENYHRRLPPRHFVQRSNGQSYFDGPPVCHNAVQHGHLTPHQWMGECDGPRSYVNAAVTIIEDSHNGPYDHIPSYY